MSFLDYLCENNPKKKMLMIEAINNAFDNVQPKDNKALHKLEMSK